MNSDASYSTKEVEISKKGIPNINNIICIDDKNIIIFSDEKIVLVTDFESIVQNKNLTISNKRYMGGIKLSENIVVLI